MLFFNKQYAQANSGLYEVTPRAFLLSMAAKAPAHALLVAYWGQEGGAVLSLPTREYFQSSGWVEETPAQPPTMDDSGMMNYPGHAPEARSVRSGSEFWADGRSRTPSSQAFTSQYMGDTSYEESEKGHSYKGKRTRTRHGFGDSGDYTMEDDDNDSEGTETPGERYPDGSMIDDVGAQDAFIAGMIYALSRRICPGLPYTPAWSGEEVNGTAPESFKWRLDECLRYFFYVLSFGAVLLIYFLDLQLSFLDGKHGERHGIGPDWRMKWSRLIGSKIDW